MNRNIKQRDSITQSSSQFITQSIHSLTLSTQPSKLSLYHHLSPSDTPNINLNLKTMKTQSNRTSQSTLRKSVSSSIRDKQSQKIILQAQNYDFILLSICQFEKGIRIDIITQQNQQPNCIILINLNTIQIQRNKVKHTFPMPLIFNSSKYLKIFFKTFKELSHVDCFKIIIQSVNKNTKIKNNSVLLQLPLSTKQSNLQGDGFNLFSFGSVIELDAFKLIEQAETIRRRKFTNSQRQFTLTSSKSAECFQTLKKQQDNQFKKKKSMMVTNWESIYQDNSMKSSTIQAQQKIKKHPRNNNSKLATIHSPIMEQNLPALNDKQQSSQNQNRCTINIIKNPNIQPWSINKPTQKPSILPKRQIIHHKSPTLQLPNPVKIYKSPKYSILSENIQNKKVNIIESKQNATNTIASKQLKSAHMNLKNPIKLGALGIQSNNKVQKLKGVTSTKIKSVVAGNYTCSSFFNKERCVNNDIKKNIKGQNLIINKQIRLIQNKNSNNGSMNNTKRNINQTQGQIRKQKIQVMSKKKS